MSSYQPHNSSTDTSDKMVRLDQTLALLLAAIPTTLALDQCYCNKPSDTFHACVIATRATANPPKARRAADPQHGGWPPNDDPPHSKPIPQYPHWDYFWFENKGYCRYNWKGDPKKSSIWHLFADHCPTGASCDG